MPQQCGWLKDKFGLSWQVVPTIVPELLNDPASEKSQRAFAAIMQMKKPDTAAMKRAYDGEQGRGRMPAAAAERRRRGNPGILAYSSPGQGKPAWPLGPSAVEDGSVDDNPPARHA